MERLRSVCVASVCAALSGTSTVWRKTLLHNVPNGSAFLAVDSQCLAIPMLSEYADREMFSVPMQSARYKAWQILFFYARKPIGATRVVKTLPVFPSRVAFAVRG